MERVSYSGDASSLAWDDCALAGFASGSWGLMAVGGEMDAAMGGISPRSRAQTNASLGAVADGNGDLDLAIQHAQRVQDDPHWKKIATSQMKWLRRSWTARRDRLWRLHRPPRWSGRALSRWSAEVGDQNTRGRAW